MELCDGRFRGLVYRAMEPVYARHPLSGRGAERHGGRFNRQGTEALYTALKMATVVREVTRMVRFQPIVVVACYADVGPVFDARDAAALERYGITSEALANPHWHTTAQDRSTAPTQDFAAALIAEGFAGLLVRSFARGAAADDLNLVLWRWSGAGCALEVVDDEGRLGRL